MKPTVTMVISGLFLSYIAYSMYTIALIFFPTHCVEKGKHQKCIQPYIAKHKKLQMSIYTSLKSSRISSNDLTLIWHYSNFTIHDVVEKEFNVSIPSKTRRNGTLYLHVFVYPRKQDPFTSQYTSNDQSAITTYMVPQSGVFNLLGDTAKEDSKPKTAGRKAVTHWRSKVTVTVMEDEIAFDRQGIPGEIMKYLRISPEGEYLPLVYIDQLGFRTKDLVEVNKSVDTLPLVITYSPISVGKLRMWSNMLQSIQMLHGLGFTEKDTDEIKGIFSDTNFVFLMLTFAVAAFHLLFDFLAFKNDISYWKNRDTMVGLSTRAVVWRCVSQAVIFFYLMDEETSLLVLIPAGISTIIEAWKVKKAFKIALSWKGIIPKLSFGSSSDKELETAEFDSQAMKYLSYILYPLCLGGAGYSLMYVEHKSWYSWCIQSLVNGVYAFGFLFMLPQLFVNYKLKSVAHLPWRAFMYKAFNTFIDDIFAFIITMPTAHRLACFRDDLVFLVYLYQRWLYPVDKKRVNEYGQSFDDAVTEKPKKE
ncbi:lipid scramblase CLPTM1L-like [Ruditapes philippinarum]|uniref:lipid scramblase CLPTM1L-like n=1 Tax=Ruditapes philippinarum TaxID=129788 RepID=UPI00295AC1E4|nr:lipid scramblase CLPTM1L-like [Ruditapes philippinarum]